ncbi:MAG: XTP/dITP diphosphatase [Firmicutes bacterium]|nr:XTP/dITP diphosphatase [Bacillota bacterium]
MKAIAATKNKGKIREMREILSPLGFDVVSQQEIEIDIDVEETGDTFEKNALIKARAVAMVCDYPVLADDSGICVDALGGAPGVRSARYAGDNATDADRINKMLAEIGGSENRGAKFVTAVAFIFPDGKEITASGEVKGHITKEPMGDNGFGYDPIFYCDELGKTFAQSSDDEKNSVSHRGRALKNLYDKLKNMEEEQL